MLSATDIECLRGSRRLFTGVSLSVAPGECLLVQGPNGCGKTSLLRILGGIARPERGEVRWMARPIAELGDEYRNDLAWCGHANALKDELSPAENLLAAAAVRGMRTQRSRALAALEALGVAHLDALPVRALSQGQKRRVSLARLGLVPGRLWLLDEPLTSLDAAAAVTLAGLVDAHLERGGVAVLSSHQPIALRAAVRSFTFA